MLVSLDVFSQCIWLCACLPLCIYSTFPTPLVFYRASVSSPPWGHHLIRVSWVISPPVCRVCSPCFFPRVRFCFLGLFCTFEGRSHPADPAENQPSAMRCPRAALAITDDCQWNWPKLQNYRPLSQKKKKKKKKASSQLLACQAPYLHCSYTPGKDNGSDCLIL